MLVTSFAMAIRGYYLGCPAWGIKEWAGTLYRRGSRAGDYLSQYAEVFNTVEGNTTFYSLPSAESVDRWRDATPSSFRFCFKFPRTISHVKGLRYAAAETEEFLARMAPLGERLGAFMLQLPPAFGPERLSLLARFLEGLPARFRYAVELRHPDFYRPREEGGAAEAADELLIARRCERVIMDTRALRSGDDQHPAVLGARHRKPNLPVREKALGEEPILRFIGHPHSLVNHPWIETWCDVLGGWLAAGKTPFVFIHRPDNAFAPPFAREFHAALSQSLSSREVGGMPVWPGEKGQLSLL
ncbi:MAG: DUF72 domain-containing protein [Acidobacteriota bacterium]